MKTLILAFIFTVINLISYEVTLSDEQAISILVDKRPSLPNFKNEKSLQDILKSRKIRVAFIDFGNLSDDENTQGFRISEMIQSKVTHSHGDSVVRSFIKTLKETVDNPENKIEIVYCSVLRQEFLDRCLDFIKAADVDFLNLSWEINNLSKSELKSLNQIADNGVILTVSAGNEGRLVRFNSLCSVKIVNKVCVAGTDFDTGKLHISSNFGKTVNAFEDMTITIITHGVHSGEMGTSFSASIHLAKIISRKLNNQEYDYNKNHQDFIKAEFSSENLIAKSNLIRPYLVSHENYCLNSHYFYFSMLFFF